MKVNLYEESPRNQEVGALKTLEMGEWAAMFFKDGTIRWFHNHAVATGRIRVPWPWNKDCCDACGCRIPEEVRMLAELQKIKVLRETEGEESQP